MNFEFQNWLEISAIEMKVENGIYHVIHENIVNFVTAELPNLTLLKIDQSS